MLSILLSLVFTAQAQEVGLGVAIGSPSGLTLKWYTGEGGAFDFLVGGTWSGGFSRTSLLISGDYLINVANLAKGSGARLNLYGGPGVNLWFNSYDTSAQIGGIYDYGFLALEFPVGLSLRPREVPLEVYFEVAPMAVVLNDFGFALGGAAGLRYYF